MRFFIYNPAGRTPDNIYQIEIGGCSKQTTEIEFIKKAAEGYRKPHISLCIKEVSNWLKK